MKKTKPIGARFARGNPATCPHGSPMLTWAGGAPTTTCTICRPPSPEMLALARRCIEKQAERDRMLAAMTPDEQERFRKDEIKKLAEALAEFTD